jgi:hypothetical protein
MSTSESCMVWWMLGLVSITVYIMKMYSVHLGSSVYTMQDEFT